jgi:hypothetical protein
MSTGILLVDIPGARAELQEPEYHPVDIESRKATDE